MDERHGLNPALAFGQRLDGLGFLDGSRLESQEARDDLQVVLHAVVQLAQQDLLFFERPRGLLLRALALGDVANRNLQNCVMRVLR